MHRLVLLAFSAGAPAFRDAVLTVGLDRKTKVGRVTPVSTHRARKKLS